MFCGGVTYLAFIIADIFILVATGAPFRSSIPLLVRKGRMQNVDTVILFSHDGIISENERGGR